MHRRHCATHHWKVKSAEEHTHIHHRDASLLGLSETIRWSLEWSSRIYFCTRPVLRPSSTQLLQLRDLHILLHDELFLDSGVLCHQRLEWCRHAGSPIQGEVLLYGLSGIVDILYRGNLLHFLGLQRIQGSISFNLFF